MSIYFSRLFLIQNRYQRDNYYKDYKTSSLSKVSMDFARPAKDTELANVTLSGDDGIEGSGASDPEGSGGGRRVSILKTIMKQV